VHADERGPGRAKAIESRQRRLAGRRARFVDFVAGLRDVRVDREVELAREGDYLAPRCVAHGVWRVRRQRKGESRRMLVRIARRETLRQVGVGIGRIRRRKIEHRHADQRAHAGGLERLRGGVRIKIHVRRGCDTARKHLRGRVERPVVNEFGRYVQSFARPNLCGEPSLQRDIVSDAAKERHRGVRVRVHEARDQHVRRQRHARARSKGISGLRRRQNGDNAAAVDDQRVIVERARRVDRHDPPRIDTQIDRTRRFHGHSLAESHSLFRELATRKAKGCSRAFHACSEFNRTKVGFHFRPVK
jgi:hypothetical protein